MKVVIGLETHVQLNSQSKIFCGCRNPVLFSEEPEPNTLTCPTCLGFPGSKPRLNERVVQEALQVALCLNCRISLEMFFSRKTYFYPDMSKNYQITQYEIPLGEGGSLSVQGKTIRIKRLHIEEDPARLIHQGGMGGTVLADYNRAGIPLIEIVTEPDFSSPQEARIYLQKLALIIEYLGIYHPSSKAIIKSDANISLQEESAKGIVGVRVEVKNITGTKEIEKALSYEIVRQTSIIRKGQHVLRETRMWNPDLGITQPLRNKEEEEEYGYIFEPDLTPIELHKQMIHTVSKNLPELPDQRYARLVKTYKLPEKVAESIVSDIDLANLFENISKKIDPKIAGSWIAGYLKKTLNYNDITYRQSGILDEWMVHLLNLFKKEQITDRNAEMTIRKMIEDKLPPEKIIKKYGYMVKRFDVDVVLHALVEKNHKAVLDYAKGEQKALHFLVGLAMKETQGTVDANDIRKRLLGIMKGMK